jgi:hypothetical protein
VNQRNRTRPISLILMKTNQFLSIFEAMYTNVVQPHSVRGPQCNFGEGNFATL